MTVTAEDPSKAALRVHQFLSSIYDLSETQLADVNLIALRARDCRIASATALMQVMSQVRVLAVGFAEMV